MWRDEFQPWLIARDSASLVDVLEKSRHEGHPAVWYVLLFFLTRLTQSPTVMQATHLLIACLVVYVFARCSPFNPLQKFLFAFGYFPFYEYAVLSRNYGIGVLFLFLACAQWPSRHTHPLRLATMLALASNTSVHALIIALAMELGLILEILLRRKIIFSLPAVRAWRVYCGFAVMAAGVLLALHQMVPPRDSSIVTLSVERVPVGTILNSFIAAFFPIPGHEAHFWGTNILDEYWRFARMKIYCSCALVASLIATFMRRPLALTTFAAGAAGLLGFFYITSIGDLRHHGFLFILFMVAAWLYRSSEDDEGTPALVRAGFPGGIAPTALVTPVLIFQLSGGISAFQMALKNVFSNGQRASVYIKEHGLARLPIAGDVDYAMASIVGYLNKDKVYFPRANRFGSYVIWDKSRLHQMSQEELLRRTTAFAKAAGQDILLIVNYPLPKDLAASRSISHIASFTGATMGDEDFHLYLFPVEPHRAEKH